VTSEMASNVCPECGAALAPGESCEERFQRCLALEYEDWTGYGVVHHLTVPAYMLQHPSRYSREGRLEARHLLAAFLAGESPTAVRRQNRTRLDSGHRSWRMTRGAGVEAPAGKTWSRTIASVRTENPADFCADVVDWARAVLSDTAAGHTQAQG
jgi:hypothetical protein